MEIFTLIGMRRVNFKGQDGNPVDGWNLFFQYSDRNITGYGTEKIFISAAKFNEVTFMPEIGADCQLLYNKYGKVADIIKA